MNEINVRYSSIREEYFSKNWETFLHKLPTALQNHCSKFRQIEDKKKRILGLYLLTDILQSVNLDAKNMLAHYKWDQYKKPFFESKPDWHFSLSYSKDLSICAVANQVIGIDIECMEESLDLHSFSSFFPKKIWDSIQSAKDKVTSFYTYWTLVEAAMKAKGLGIAGPVKDIRFNEEAIFTGQSKWHYHKITANSKYMAHICSTNAESIRSKKSIFSKETLQE